MTDYITTQLGAPAGTDLQTVPNWHPNGLTIPGSLSFAEWEQLGSTLSTMEAGVNWWIGDWLNYGERQYGEKYAQAVLETGRTPDSLSNLAAVARRIELPLRNGNLSWSHHAIVAYLQPSERAALLADAERNQWTCARLREAVKERKNAIATPAPADNLPAREDSAPPSETAAPDPEPAKSAPYVDNLGPVLVGDERDDDDFDPLIELEAAHRELEEVQVLLDSLQSTDHAREIVKLTNQYRQLEGRLRQEIQRANEAAKQAKRQGDILRKIREALGVETNAAILTALGRRAA